MSDQITYDNKVDLQVATNIANINKVTASDMNEIKNVVNSHADDIDVANNNITDLNNNKLDIDAVLNQASTDTDKPYSADYLNDKLVSVGTTAPTDGERVWFKKGINLVDKSTILKMTTINPTTGLPESTSDFIFTTQLIKVKPNTDYYVKAGPVVIYAYDTNKSFMSTIRNDPNAGTFNTGTAEYIRGKNWWAKNIDEMNTQINDAFIYEGTTDTTYEPYVDEGIYVDNEQWYDKSLMIKSKYFSSITTSDAGYYDLGLISNEVAVIGIKHNAVDVATKLELYSNQLGHIFVRCSVSGNYVAKTIYNLTIYYI